MNTIPKPTILIILIHHYDPSRLQHILPHLTQLASYWSDLYDVQLSEIAYQPPLHSSPNKPSFLWCMARYYQLLITQKKWHVHLDRPITIPVWIKWCYQLIHYAFKTQADKQKYRRKQAIEVRVSDKHTQAWDMLLQSDKELLMVVEDDAIFDEHSVERLSLACRTALATNKSSGVYVDLAGGYPLEELHIGSLITTQQNGITTFAKPVTNTACGYMINQPLAQQWKKTVLKDPRIRLLPSDWLINDCMMAVPHHMPLSCHHVTPSALIHGSITRAHPSWGNDFQATSQS